MIGTPFVSNDEVHNRKIEHLDKKPWEQEARDDKGNKHFYGAFTGALRESSAGYKGTVGSKEGFQPQQFVSSRSNRDKNRKNTNQDGGEELQTGKKQDILDFMDEEDLGEHHLPGSSLTSANAQLQNDPKQASKTNAAPVVYSIQSLSGIKGRQILSNIMSTSPDEQGGTKFMESSESDIDLDFAAQNNQNQQSSIQKRRKQKQTEKRDKYGLGYQPSAQEIELQKLQQERQSSSHRFSTTSQGKKTNTQIKMSQFNEDDCDVEDDEDGEHMAQIYSKSDSFSHQVSNQPHQFINLTSQQHRVQECQFLVGGMLQTTQQIKTTGTATMLIRPPPNYDPFSEAAKNQQEGKSKAQKSAAQLSQQFKATSNKLDAFSRSKLLEGNTDSKGAKTEAKLPDELMRLVPFKEDKDKVLRFSAHYFEETGQIIVFDIPNNMMTGSMMRKERDEFNAIIVKHRELQVKRKSQYLAYTSKDKVQNANDNSKTKNVKMDAFDWQPSRLVILRFGLQNIVEKRKLKPVTEQTEEQDQQARKVVSFSKAGCSDVTGDDYFNTVQEEFQMSKDGKEVVPRLLNKASSSLDCHKDSQVDDN